MKTSKMPWFKHYPYIIFFCILLGFELSGTKYTYADWQSVLEKHFDIVCTFDDLQDWTGVNSGIDNKLANQPKKFDNSNSIWLAYERAASASVGPWIGNHGSDYVWRGSKSLRMSFENFAGGLDCQYGPQMMEAYFGDGNNTSGKSTVYVFYMLKFHHDRIDLSSMPYSWKPSGINNEYYLQKNESDPGLLMPNTLIINGTWIDDPIVLGLSGNSAYETRDDKIGSLRDNEWAYGDKNSLGYETIYIRLAGGNDPNGKSKNYIQYENGYFTQKGEDNLNWCGVIKHFRVGTGFVSVREWKSSGGDVGCIDQNKFTYGCDFQIWQIINDVTSSGMRFKDYVNLSRWTGDCYNYEHVIQDRTWSSNFGSCYRNGQWVGVEYKVSVGTVNVADGSAEMWLYDPNGNIIAYDSKGPEMHLRNFANFKYNKIAFGGNRIGTNYNYEEADSWQNRYYIDDLIINNSRIGKIYFDLLLTPIRSNGKLIE